MILVLAWEMAVMTPPIPAGAGAAVAVPAELAAVAEDDELDARPVPGGQPLGPSALGTPHWLSLQGSYEEDSNTGIMGLGVAQ
jgi:hypothetical protein